MKDYGLVLDDFMKYLINERNRWKAAYNVGAKTDSGVAQDDSSRAKYMTIVEAIYTLEKMIDSYDA